jgi:hypothetical protein
MRLEKKDLEASRPCLGDVLGGEGGYCGIAVIGGDIEPLLSALLLPAPFWPSACSKFSCRCGDAGFDLGDLDDLGLSVEGLRCWRLSVSAGLLVALRFSDGGAVDFGILQVFDRPIVRSNANRLPASNICVWRSIGEKARRAWVLLDLKFAFTISPMRTK